jgi:tRNA dimethylallyltransferase
MKNLPKIIVILGPTASGKTDFGIALAKKFAGEIISADSRQVYKKMDIGTGKPAGKWREGVYLVEGIPHYIMDIIEPDEEFTVAHFKKLAEEKIVDILRRKKIPIIVGGTGLYIWSVVDNLELPAVVPDLNLRQALEKKNLEEQVAILKDKDPDTAKKIDLKNPRRVLRALEVVLASGQSFVAQKKQAPPAYNALQIGLNWPRAELYMRIEKRIDEQMESGWAEETKKILAAGFNSQLPSMSGIGYKQLADYLRGVKGLEETIREIKKNTKNYAKRQITWFRRDKRIKWLERDDFAEAEKLVAEFIV